MNRQQIILGGVTLALMGMTAAVLIHLREYQRLGDPGIKTRPLAGGKNLEIMMPESIPGYTSIILTNVEMSLKVLPDDTSFRSRAYMSSNFAMEVTTVLMGRDRSSIHAPQICMTGQGWALDEAAPTVVGIPMQRPLAYHLPVNKLLSTKQFKDEDGSIKTVRGVYLYWFVDGNQFTPSEWKRKLWIVPHDMLLTGVLDRFAYIACFSACAPGEESATCDRMEKMIAELIPEFQLVPRPAG